MCGMRHVIHVLIQTSRTGDMLPPQPFREFSSFALCSCVSGGPFARCDGVTQFSFKHGAFEKVNYLGYDDHVVLDQSISFLLGRDGHSKKKAFKKSKSKIKKGSRRRLASGHGDAKDGGKLLTILTVRKRVRPPDISSCSWLSSQFATRNVYRMYVHTPAAGSLESFVVTCTCTSSFHHWCINYSKLVVHASCF